MMSDCWGVHSKSPEIACSTWLSATQFFFIYLTTGSPMQAAYITITTKNNLFNITGL